MHRRNGYRSVSHRGYTNSILDFEDVHVPGDALLGEEGEGLAAGTWLSATRLRVAATCLGRAERALDLSMAHAASRVQFGQPIGRFQGVAFKLADMATELRAAELLRRSAAWKVAQGTAADADIAMAKLKATEMLAMVADEAIQIHGGMGLMDELPLERIWRDARIERIWDGPRRSSATSFHGRSCALGSVTDDLRHAPGNPYAPRRQHPRGDPRPAEGQRHRPGDQPGDGGGVRGLPRTTPSCEWRSCARRATGSSPPAGTSRPLPLATPSTATTVSAVSAGCRSSPTSTSQSSPRHGGLALGGGFELALSCDLIYASETTQFGLPEINAGTLADAATVKLPKRIPYHVAMDLLLTGRRMSAAEAARWGLVNEVLADEAAVQARAWKVARLLAAGPPLVFAAIKETVRVAESLTFGEAMDLITTSSLPTVATLYQSEDQLEGARAFAEKRSPQWKGR